MLGKFILDKELTITERGYLLGIILTCATLPFNNIALNSICIIITSLFGLINIYKQKRPLKINNVLAAFIVFYLLHLLFMINTSNLKNGFFELEKKLSLIVLPIILLLNRPLTHYEKKVAMTTFVISCITMLFFSLFQIYNYTLSGMPPLLYIDGSYNYREYFVQVAERHPTYTSFYLMFCVVFVINLIRIQQIQPWLGVLICFFLIVFVFLLSSRLIIIGSIIFFCLYFFYKQQGGGGRKITTAFLWILGMLTISVFIIFKVPSIKSRLVEEFYDEYTFGPAKGIHYNSLNTRISETICGLDIIASNTLSGVGTGDVQDELNRCYEKNGYSSVLYERSYNPHNQFIHTFAGLGILGFLSLLVLFVLLFKNIDLVNLPEYSFVVVLTLLLFFTETFFGFQKGVVFFSLFVPLLYIKKM